MTTDQELVALRRENELRWEAHLREHTQHELAHGREHEMTTGALLKAETAMDRRLESMNEFRATLTEQAATFWTRDQQRGYSSGRDLQNEALDKRLDVLERAQAIEQAERMTSRDTLTKRMWMIGIGVGLVTFVVGILTRAAGW